jgi:hypothetical protein
LSAILKTRLFQYRNSEVQSIMVFFSFTGKRKKNSNCGIFFKPSSVTLFMDGPEMQLAGSKGGLLE